MKSMLFKKLMLCLAFFSCHALADDFSHLIKKADGYRMSANNMQIDTLISLFDKEGVLSKERRYTVFSQEKRQTLVVMQSPAEKGQKILMQGDNFWFLLPDSKRPIRITPMQKLLGEASIGDVATLSWSEDYSGKRVGDEKCDEKACIHLSLTANRSGVTYQRIELWLGKTHSEPLKADMYVQSDKLAKQARFVMNTSASPSKMVEMILTDQLNNGRQTKISYLHQEERKIPEAWLNPMFLSSNPVLQ